MHPLILGLFANPSAAAAAARDLRALGIARERVSVVARTHDEEGALADATGASPGSEMEDSRTASRLGELSADLIAAIALVVPGVGPIVAHGPLSAGLGEAAGHVAGGLARTLHHAGLDRTEAERWETCIERGAILVGAHVDDRTLQPAREVFEQNAAESVAQASWRD